LLIGYRPNLLKLINIKQLQPIQGAVTLLQNAHCRCLKHQENILFCLKIQNLLRKCHVNFN